MCKLKYSVALELDNVLCRIAGFISSLKFLKMIFKVDLSQSISIVLAIMHTIELYKKKPNKCYTFYNVTLLYIGS